MCRGQLWRLVTWGVLHAGPLHLMVSGIRAPQACTHTKYCRNLHPSTGI